MEIEIIKYNSEPCSINGCSNDAKFAINGEDNPVFCEFCMRKIQGVKLPKKTIEKHQWLYKEADEEEFSITSYYATKQEVIKEYNLDAGCIIIAVEQTAKMDYE